MKESLFKEIKSYRMAIISRPLLIIALIQIVAIVLVFNIEYALGIGNEYNELSPDNIMSQEGLKEGDESFWYGEVEDIRHIILDEGDSYTVVLHDVSWNGIILTGAGRYIQVYMDDVNNVRQGSLIKIKGKLDYYDYPRNHGEFNSYKYYHNRGYLFALKDAVLLEYSEEYDKTAYTLYLYRCNVATKLDELYGKEDAAILKAMLLGVKEEIDSDLKKSFQKNGIAHILAISGLHISFLCMTLYSVFVRLGFPLPVCVVLSEIILVTYILMVGFSPSAFRAAIMFSMFLIAKILKRSYDMISSMSAASIVILSINPGYLYDSSYQLSFLAIVAVSFFYKMHINNSSNLKKILEKRSKTEIRGKLYNLFADKIINAFLVSFWVYLVTLPVLLCCYFETAFYSVILNIVVIPLMSVLLLAAMVSTIMTDAVNFAWFPFALIVKCILNFYKETCRFLEQNVPGRLNLGKPAWWVVMIYYILLLLICLYGGKNRVKIQLFAFSCCFILMTVRIYPFSRLCMLDVGQGDGIVYIGNDKRVYLFDGGSSSKRNVGSKRIIPFLKYYGVKRVEGIFLSHPDSDHINGIEELIELSQEECIDISCIYIFAGYMEDEGYQNIRELATNKGIEVKGINRGKLLSDGMLEIECIYPGDGDAIASDNDSSLVLRLKYGDFSFLEMGDAEIDAENVILDNYEMSQMNIDVLKVGHHGSSSSSSVEFIHELSPQIALISAGMHNSYGHPHKETMNTLEKTGADIIQTKDSGEICIELRKKGSKYLIYKYLDILE